MTSLMLVSSQMLLLFLIIIPTVSFSSHHASVITGLACCATACALALWAMASLSTKNFSVLPEPVQGGSLCKNGPYRLIRHPMYTAVLLGSLGMCLIYQDSLKWLYLLILFAVLALKIRREERLLKNTYANYSQYMQNTKALLPFIV